MTKAVHRNRQPPKSVSKVSALSLLAVGVPFLTACNRAPAETNLQETKGRPASSVSVRVSADRAGAVRAGAAKRVETNPATLMPGALGVTSEDLPVADKRPTITIKSTGKKGEWLEGDVFMFRLVSTEICGEPIKASATGAAATPEVTDTATVPAGLPSGRTVLGAKVEIRAKAKMAISPRDVSLSKGGINFVGSVDPGRRLKGCTPLLEIGRLNAKEVATGYVLFDVPSPDFKPLELGYQPTRWGGAGQVRISLHE